MEPKKSITEAVEARGKGIVVPMLDPKDLEINLTAVVPPAYVDGIDNHKRWSERFNKQCAEIVDQYKSVLDYQDQDRFTGNSPIEAEEEVPVKGAVLTESLHGMEEIEDFFRMADQIGLKTMGDLKRFLNECSRDPNGRMKSDYKKMFDYLNDELKNLDFVAKDESLTEAAEDNQEIPSDQAEQQPAAEEVQPEAQVKINLKQFKPWGRATDTYNQIKAAGKFEEFENLLAEGWPDGIEDQTLNELLSEDRDYIAEMLDMEFVQEQ